MAVDINLLDVWDRLQNSAYKRLLGTAPALPESALMQYLYLEGIRQKARQH